MVAFYFPLFPHGSNPGVHGSVHGLFCNPTFQKSLIFAHFQNPDLNSAL